MITSNGNLCRTKVSAKKSTILWRIDDYKSVHEKRMTTISSSPFSSDDDEFKWILYLNPTPTGTTTRKYVSLTLYPKNTTTLENFSPISGTVKCCILNENNIETKSQSKEFLMNSTSSSSAYVHFPTFVEETYLNNEDNRLLPHDKLTIFCEVSYIKKIDIVNVGQSFSNLQHEEHMPVCLEILYTLFRNPEFSDVTIHVNREDYPAHRNILAARSPVFKAMFMNDMQEKQTSRIEIKDMSKETFVEMLRYIYTGQPQNLEMLVSELLVAADKYDLDKLKSICEKQLYEKLSPETAVNTLRLAYMHHASRLKTQALQYIKINSYNSRILDTETRKELLEKCPLILFEILDIFGKQSST